MHAVSFKWALPFCSPKLGNGSIFPWVDDFFSAKLGNGLLFQFWLDDWLLKAFYKRHFLAFLRLQETLEPWWEIFGKESVI